MNPKDCMRSVEEMKLLEEISRLKAQLERAREGLEYYAKQEHYLGTEAWDTVSGESEDWLFDVLDDDARAGVENGAVARITLASLDDAKPGEHVTLPVKFMVRSPSTTECWEYDDLDTAQKRRAKMNCSPDGFHDWCVWEVTIGKQEPSIAEALESLRQPGK